jgi:formylglycine-generating enzyme required for sulfatase activity
MVLVEPGSFQMGSMHAYPDQQPVHTVNITKPFFIAKYEMTFEDYDRFCEDTHSAKPDDRGWGRGKQALLHVDWNDAIRYCNWISQKAGLTPCYSGKGKRTLCDFSANGYRLPTEAEWGYAARGAQKSQGFMYAGGNDPGEVAWFADNSSDQVHIVGQKLPNELGIYDMSGNIYEWCWDWYSKDYYAASPANDPQGPPPPETNKPYEFLRSRRSGSWREGEADITTTKRSFDAVDYPGDNGFRLVRNA